MNFKIPPPYPPAKKWGGGGFEARTKPYQIKQTESKSAKKLRSSIFH